MIHVENRESLNRPTRLIAFDLDGTLATGNVWETMNSMAGITAEEDSEWFRQYQNQEISYREWINLISERYRKSGKKKEDFEEVVQRQVEENITDEAKSLIENLQQKNEELCIVSAGIDLYVAAAARSLGIKRWFANNTFEFDEDGNFIKILIHDDESEAKVSFLQKIGANLGLMPSDIIFVGDSSNDLGAFRHTGKGVYVRNGKQKPDLESASWRQIDSMNELLNLISDFSVS